MKRDRLTEASIHASWITGQIRSAVWGSNYSPPKPLDLYNPDAARKERAREVQDDRKKTLDLFPKIITPQ